MSNDGAESTRPSLREQLDAAETQEERSEIVRAWTDRHIENNRDIFDKLGNG